MNRTEGQLWIDRDAPYGLKYHTHGNTYQVGTTLVYKASAAVNAGCLVAVDSISGDTVTFRPAQFPQDIDSILGICPKDVLAGKETAILRDGIIELSSSQLSNCLHYRTGDFPNSLNLRNAPVYWFIGRSYKDGTYKYDEPKNNKGKITLSTPSGMRWGQGINGGENSFNVGYSNLPTIGTVLNYTVSDGVLQSLTISLNISRFDSSLEWHWPYSKKNGSDQDVDLGYGDIELPIRHGLFPTSINSEHTDEYEFRPRCFCDAILIDNGTDVEHTATIGVDNYYGYAESAPPNDDKRTVVYIKSNTTSENPKRLNIHGKVVYTFVKQR